MGLLRFVGHRFIYLNVALLSAYIPVFSKLLIPGAPFFSEFELAGASLVHPKK